MENGSDLRGFLAGRFYASLDTDLPDCRAGRGRVGIWRNRRGCRRRGAGSVSDFRGSLPHKPDLWIGNGPKAADASALAKVPLNRGNGERRQLDVAAGGKVADVRAIFSS